MRLFAVLGTFSLVFLALLGAKPACAAKLTDTEKTRIDEPRPPGLASDAEIVAAGAVIGRVIIDIRQIFNENDNRENSGIFRLANDLHIKTKQATIESQLLFRAGERFDPKKLAETERNLRTLRYIYDARVVPVKFENGKVDVKVITKDVWTLSPGISFGRSGGSNNTRFELEEHNLFGWGKTIQVSHGANVDRTTNAIDYEDANLFGSRWTLGAYYANSNDGSDRNFSTGMPFYSLDTPWSVTVKARQYRRTVSRYNLGQIEDQFQRNERYYELSGGLSSGLIDGWTRRWTAGVRYDDNRFTQVSTGRAALELPSQRTVSYPYVGFNLIEDDYRKVGDQNQIGRTEDLFFGTLVGVELGFSNSAFGSNRNAAILNGNASKGFQLTSKQQLFLTSTFTSRVEGSDVRNLILDGVATYYWRIQPDKVFYVSLNGTTTRSLDADSQLVIGGDNGLRGYPLRYEAGTSRMLLTVEQRFFTEWYPFRLARFGAAVFADVGRTWGSGVVGNSDPGMLSDIGGGLRFGNTRSGLGNVLHIDFAYPLNNGPGIRKLQVIIGTKESF